MWQIVHEACKHFKSIFMFQKGICCTPCGECKLLMQISYVELYKSTFYQPSFIQHKGSRQAPVEMLHQRQIFGGTLECFNHLYQTDTDPAAVRVTVMHFNQL